MARRAASIAALVLLLATLAIASEAGAQCTTKEEARAVAQSVRKGVRCNERLLRFTNAACEVPPPPACAGNLVEHAVALAYGPNNPPAVAVDRRAVKLQLRCQRRIGRAVAAFVGVKMRNVVAGKTRAEAEQRARSRLDRLEKRCVVTVAEDAAGVVVPAVGTPCEDHVGVPGHRVDGEGLGACFLGALEAEVDRVSPVPPSRPNLLIILTDDQRWDTLGLTHSRDGVTPVMPNVQAELVASGVTFPNAFVTTALCCPSRASILKGQYAHTTGVLTNKQPLGGALNFDDTSTVASWLQTAGYRTGFFGKYLNGYNGLWGPGEPPYVPPGWDEWHAFERPRYYDYYLVEHGAGFDHAYNFYPSNCPAYGSCPGDDVEPCPAPEHYSTYLLLQKALDFVDQADGRPFLLYFTPYAPHGPACPAKQDEGLFSGVTPWRPPNWNEVDASDKPTWVQNLCPMGANKQANIDALRIRQLESLQAVDRAVGALMDKLRQIGQDANTLVIFTSDNGFSWGSHCHRAKRCPYDECMRVPLVMHYPELAPLPTTEARFGLNIDFAFTAAELAGLVPPISQGGRSLVPLIGGIAPMWRPDFLYEQWSDPADATDPKKPPTLAGVRTSEWKYIEYTTDETELYDLRTDPFELGNETDNPAWAGVKAALAARLRQLRPDWPPPASPSGAFLDTRPVLD